MNSRERSGGGFNIRQQNLFLPRNVTDIPPHIRRHIHMYIYIYIHVHTIYPIPPIFKQIPSDTIPPNKNDSAMRWAGDSQGQGYRGFRGMQAVRHNRYVILPKDFEAGWKDHAAGRKYDYVGVYVDVYVDVHVVDDDGDDDVVVGVVDDDSTLFLTLAWRVLFFLFENPISERSLHTHLYHLWRV